MSYQINIIKQTQQNTNFRTVLYTGQLSQLVVMDVKPGESIGQETHEHVEQILFFPSGSGKAVLNGEEKPITAGDIVVVNPGVEHDFINTGTDSLKVYTIYTPANHIDGRIHVTKADAEADVEDEEFGHKVEG